MELRQPKKNLLVLKEDLWLEQIIWIALAASGILLGMASGKHYGFQAWYRFTFTAGWIFPILIGPIYYFRMQPITASFDSERRILLLTRRTLFSAKEESISWDNIAELKMGKGKSWLSGYGSRLILLRTDGVEMPLQSRWTRAETQLLEMKEKIDDFISR